MKKAILVGIPMFLVIVGMLCFLAGRYDLMPSNYARFAGMAFILFSGLGWVIYGVVEKSETSAKSKGD